MKKQTVSILVVAVVFAALAGCKALNKLTQFYLKYDTSYTYPAGLPVDIPVTAIPEIATNVQQQFKNNNTRSDLIQSAKLSDLVLTITPAGTQSFSFLKSVEIFISAPSMAESKVAYKYDIPDTIGDYLALDVTNAELKGYMAADSFSVRISSVIDKTVKSGITANLHSRFFIDAKILGI